MLEISLELLMNSRLILLQLRESLVVDIKNLDECPWLFSVSSTVATSWSLIRRIDTLWKPGSVAFSQWHLSLSAPTGLQRFEHQLFHCWPTKILYPAREPSSKGVWIVFPECWYKFRQKQQVHLGFEGHGAVVTAFSVPLCCDVEPQAIKTPLFADGAKCCSAWWFKTHRSYF